MKTLFFISNSDFSINSANATNSKFLHEAFIKCDGFNKIKYGGIVCLTKKPLYVSSILSKAYVFSLGSLNFKFLIKIEDKAYYYFWKIIIFVFFVFLFIKKIFNNKFKPLIHTRDIYTAYLCEYFCIKYTLELHRVFEIEENYFGKIIKKSYKGKSYLKRLFPISKGIIEYIISSKKIAIRDYLEIFTPVLKNVNNSNLKPKIWRNVSFGNRKLDIERGIKLLYVGHPYKDRGILEAIPHICKLKKISLIIVGISEDEIKYLRKKFYPVFDNIFLSTNLDYELCIKIIHSVDGLLIPYPNDLKTRDFAYPTKATEYMSTNLPIFSSDLSILKNSFGERALYFPSGDYLSMCKIIKNYFFKEDHIRFWKKINFPEWDFRAKQVLNSFIKKKNK